jgi:glucose-1-phosphate cytidylyltransferase
MKTVILAGGYGTRISEESAVRPKPMVEIGGHPILWHIMKLFSAHGINDFIICCGYKGYMIKEYFSKYWLHMSDVTFDLKNNGLKVHIKEYFSKYWLHMSDVTFDLKNNGLKVHQNNVEPWKVTLIDTGEGTMTGGRIKRVKDYIGNESFCLTYGDGVASLNISELIKFHLQQKTLTTLTAVQAPGRFGALALKKDEDTITTFREKPLGDGAWINGGFFVCEPAVIDYISDDSTVWEQEPLQNLARDGMLSAFKHDGFWHPMDTLRDKNVLEELWQSGEAPWKVW